MRPIPSCFFIESSPGRYVATELTRGPWSEAHQHGGPPSALLARALAEHGDDAEDWQIVRLTVDLLRPIPIGVVCVRASHRRAGRTAQWLDAELDDDDGRALARASAVRVRRAEVVLPPPKDPPPSPLPSVEGLSPFVFPFFSAEVGYQRAVDVRIARGRWGEEPTAAWLRPRFPLVEDKATSPLEALTIVADAANGVAVVLDVRRFTFINPDLSLTLSRAPRGEWFGLDTHASASGEGTGLCQAELHDVAGPLGRSVQTLIVRAR